MTEVQELTAEIENLCFQRTQAREQIAKDPRQELAEQLRLEVVEAKLAGKHFAELEAERNKLVAEIHAVEWALGKDISEARRDLREAKGREAMEAYSRMTDDQLDFAAGEENHKLRAAKANVKAIRRVLDSRVTNNEAKRLVAAMSDAQRAALLAELSRGL